MAGAVSSRATNKLNDLRVRAFIKHGRVGQKLADGGGLNLIITSSGAAVWRLKYRYDGKERSISFGPYPAVGLEAARKERDAAKALLRQHADPMEHRRDRRAAGLVASGNTFEAVAEQAKIRLGGHSLREVEARPRTPSPLLAKLPSRTSRRSVLVSRVVEDVAKRGARDTAGKLSQHIRSIFAFAKARGLRDDNPADSVNQVLPAPKPPGRCPCCLPFRPLVRFRNAVAAKLLRSIWRTGSWPSPPPSAQATS